MAKLDCQKFQAEFQIDNNLKNYIPKLDKKAVILIMREDKQLMILRSIILIYIAIRKMIVLSRDNLAKVLIKKQMDI